MCYGAREMHLPTTETRKPAAVGVWEAQTGGRQTILCREGRLEPDNISEACEMKTYWNGSISAWGGELPARKVRGTIIG